jgi:hypothetical protein
VVQRQPDEEEEPQDIEPDEEDENVIQRFPVVVEARGAPHNRRGGTSMTARVGAESEWVYGSEPPGKVPTLMKTVGAEMQGKKRYVAGHLLNDNMGGLGVNNNLTVLSSNANKKHRGVEGKVKNLAQKADLINKGNNLLGDPAYDHGARYSVQVLAPAPDGTHPHSLAERYIGAGLQIDITPIRFHKVSGVESPWPQETGGTNDLTAHPIANVPPYPAAPKKKTLTPVQRHIKSALAALGHANGSSFNEIWGWIQANVAPVPSETGVRTWLRKGVSSKFFRKKAGRYKVIAKNVA